MAARSVTVDFTNNSDIALVLSSDGVSHGEWTVEPPARIEAGTTVSWESESAGIATGTEGEVFYSIETLLGQTGGQAHFHWDDPFIGANSYDESAPDGYKVDRSGGGGDNATVSWTFDCSSATCDGIPDDWKRNGVTIDPGDGSGPQFIDLPSMGANVNTPDVFVQLDWMADTKHSHALSAAAIKTVVTAFANSPYRSRTGSTGITLHVDAGPNSIMNFSTNQKWGSLSRARQLTEIPNLGTGTVSGASVTSYNWAAFDAIKNVLGGFTSTGRTSIFRYAISPHLLVAPATNSGIARGIPGSDFIVSLAAFSPLSTAQEAGTFMHELGHTLGLGHGGGDAINNKPNYVSVMNYLWQTSGLTRSGTPGIFDYSNAALATLVESALDETVGVGAAAAGVAVKHWVPAAGPNPGAFVTVADGSKAIDWNGNGKTTDKTVSFDVNNDGGTGTLTPYDDWKNLKLKGGAIGAGGAFEPPMDTSIVEITPADLHRILPADTTPPTTTAFASPAPNAAGWNRTDVTVTLTATDDISGVALTEHDLDGTGSQDTAGPILLSDEGRHTLEFHSIDRSQNVEPAQRLKVWIDKTDPEAVISYDPATDQIVVLGRDGLSGVDPGPVAPAAVTPTEWTEFGSDVAEVRRYRILDHAGNELLMTMKVRCSPETFELSVLELCYEDERRSSQHTERNTIVFRRLVGHAPDRPLLAVKQIVSVGEGESRTTVQADWDALHDESCITHRTGSFCHNEPQQSEAALQTETRGLVLLHIATDKGGLKVEE